MAGRLEQGALVEVTGVTRDDDDDDDEELQVPDPSLHPTPQ